MMDLQTKFEQVARASRKLARVEDTTINQLLLDLADTTLRSTSTILQANQKDLLRMEKSDPRYDRLRLTEDRIRDIASDIRNVASLPSPVGRVLYETVRPNGMQLRKVAVPFGVIGVIYEARPNVSFDVFSLCLKSGNACLLKGGSDAENSNTAIAALLQEVLEKHGLDPHTVELLPSDRQATASLLNARGYVDLLIPRGSSSLIHYVRAHATIPVIETGAGVCHTYFDQSGEVQKGASIIYNAKTRRVSVCNTLDCLIVHESRLPDLPSLCRKLAEKQVRIYADEAAYTVLNGQYPDTLLYPATPESYGTEYLSYALSICTVPTLDDALEHIHQYGLKHSECIATEDPEAAAIFQKAVDAACVYVNVSTAFTDGAQFGLGAEIGISTQKLHARGPMGLQELCSYKWLIQGNGQVRD